MKKLLAGLVLALIAVPVPTGALWAATKKATPKRRSMQKPKTKGTAKTSDTAKPTTKGTAKPR
jgi:hypothetical protein